MANKEKKKISNNAIRAAVFLCIIAISVIVSANLLVFADAEYTNKVLEQFYDQDEDTVDVIYFGSSATQRGWVVPVAYHDDGVASYSLATGTQPFILTKYLMEEALKTQSPRLFAVELRGICRTPDNISDVAVRRIVDNMKPSVNKFRAIKTVSDYAKLGENEVDDTGMSYYFPFLKYHSRWNPSKQPHYGTVDYYRGYALDPIVSFKVQEMVPSDWNDGYDHEKMEVVESSKEILNDLLDYCDQLDNTDVVFIISPFEAYDIGMHKLNYVKAIVEDRGYEVIDFMPPENREAIGLDNKTCYYNREHLNLYGSIKYTHYLAEYMKDNYDVPDRSGDSRYAGWEEDYERLTETFSGVYKDKYNDMVKTIVEIESGAE